MKNVLLVGLLLLIAGFCFAGFHHRAKTLAVPAAGVTKVPVTTNKIVYEDVEKVVKVPRTVIEEKTITAKKPKLV